MWLQVVFLPWATELHFSSAQAQAGSDGISLEPLVPAPGAAAKLQP
jgi:hypothetical protein